MRAAADEAIELGRPVADRALLLAGGLEHPRGQLPAAEGVLVEGSAQDGLVDGLQLPQGELLEGNPSK